MRTAPRSDPRHARFPQFARKRFGQHFLIDDQVVFEIVRYLALQTTETVVEIGPGRGALTEHLLVSGASIEAIEIDRDLVSALRQRFAESPNLAIREADALRFDFLGLGANRGMLRVIGNLPYNIATALLFHLLQARHVISDMCLMVQKEVAERLVAAPRTAAYGRLSVMIQAYADVAQIVQVHPASFTPPPKVDSSVVAIVPHRVESPDLPFNELRTVVATAFSQRRKMVRHTLGKMVPPAILSAHQIALTQRPGEISVEQYTELARSLHQYPDRIDL
ncbi:MAG: 16S rRNA (adenine(1518)-N(6)/adenine(1519)-N(6))-dimethyltransferase RsmA [Gammaproteobacteria bacterium]